MNFLRFVRTVSYLRPVQVYGRLWSRMRAPRPDTSPAPPARTASAQFEEPLRRGVSLVGRTRFVFLNEEHEVCSDQDWTNPKWAKLWLYHLHYFDDLNSDGADRRREWHLDWLHRWVKENPPGNGVGWEPYPCSRRIVNWIKWAMRGAPLPTEATHSLAVQSRWLRQRLEWHLLGNHLFANAKALVFAGMFFDGAEARRWLDRGLSIAAKELDEQVLDDGGHFERSPMYHAIFLEDLLDLVNVVLAYGHEAPASWTRKIDRMRHWLATMVHPDGKIAFFNDAALGMAPTRSQLEAYATRLGLPATCEVKEKVVYLRESGYVRLSSDDATLLADMAPLGPEYLPAHAHADTLSFELSLHGQRVFVNSGTSLYGTGPERKRQRGTAAHNTVTIDGEDSSEVWAGFRVGRRARVRHATVDGLGPTARAEHNGYQHLSGHPIHNREWRFDQRQLVVTDRIEGSGNHRVEVAFHLHPNVAVVSSAPNEYELRARSIGKAAWLSISGPAECEVHPSTYHPEFGVSQNNQRVCARYEGPLPVEVRTIVQW